MEKQYANVKSEELHPTYEMLAKVIGLEAAVKLGQEFVHQTIYFPTLFALTSSRREDRDKRLLEEYESGAFTVEQLGKKYKMTGVGISDALKRAKACNTPSEIAVPSGDALIEQIIQGLGELDEKARREVLREAIKIRNASRRRSGDNATLTQQHNKEEGK